MRLFIAEKPSLARAIADALPGPATRAKGHIRCGSNDVVVWCVGHILETATPEAYGEQYKAWALEHLPIVPREWQLRPTIPEVLQSIRRLLKEADRVVHAGDPDREGQLLVDEVLGFLGYRGPVDRVLISDVNLPAVQRALASMQPNAKYQPLSHSALARQRADWLFGMNMTRLYTLLGRKAGYPGVLSVGRVQTPLLGLIVRRDRAIASFRPVPYFVVDAVLRASSGEPFRARWVPGLDDATSLDEEGRLLRRDVADAVVRAGQGAHGSLVERRDEPKRDAPPLPFALADLQIEAARRLGLSAAQVLDACQSLYETHRLTTYPRSDCSYLPAEHHAQARAVLDAAARQAPTLLPLVERADIALRSKAWNDAKVTAHHAIVPTLAQGAPRPLSAVETAIYDLIARRYLAQFYPPFEYVQSELAIDLGGHRFRATGRQIVAPGWRAVLAPATSSEDGPATKSDEPTNASLPPVRAGEPLHVVEVTAVDKKTQAPKPFTDASLLEAMCHVAKFVTDPAIKKILSATDGIGTDATRAAIIETLFQRGYVERQKTAVVSTATGRALIDALPEVATTPDMTAIWEAAMRAILDGRQPLDAFLARVEAQLRQLVDEGKTRGAIAVAASPSARPPEAPARPPRSSRGGAGTPRAAGR